MWEHAEVWFSKMHEWYLSLTVIQHLQRLYRSTDRPENALGETSVNRRLWRRLFTSIVPKSNESRTDPRMPVLLASIRYAFQKTVRDLGQSSCSSHISHRTFVTARNCVSRLTAICIFLQRLSKGCFSSISLRCWSYIQCLGTAAFPIQADRLRLHISYTTRQSSKARSLALGTGTRVSSY